MGRYFAVYRFIYFIDRVKKTKSNKILLRCSHASHANFRWNDAKSGACAHDAHIKFPFSSAVPILQALAIVETVVENEVVARVIRTSRDALERGESLTEPMKRHWAFPPLVTQMIAIGEQTGSLDAMLAKVADFYEAEVEAATDRLKSLIEPLMIVLLASVVGTIVTSILVPMFDIFNHIQQ